MPQYYPLPENWKNRGKIKITFFPFWRNIPILKGLPLFVGDSVKFHVHVEKEGGGNPYALDVVHEILDNSLINQINIERTDTDISGTPISREGNLKFSIGMTNFPQPQDPLIITANVQSKDRWWLGCAGLFIGGIVTFIVTIASGIVLGVIEIDKFWHIINPFWK